MRGMEYLLILHVWLIATFIFKVAIIFGALFGGAYTIWRIVKSINRRDDPRHTKHPPGPP